MIELLDNIKELLINNDKIEIWEGAKYHKDSGEIEDWSHKIEVSTLGNVRYTEEYKATNKNIKDRPHIVRKGNKYCHYRQIKFVDDDNKIVFRRIHRTVLSTFHPLPKDIKIKMDGDHIDFNHNNDKLSNLQWLERSEHNRRKRTKGE